MHNLIPLIANVFKLANKLDCLFSCPATGYENSQRRAAKVLLTAEQPVIHFDEVGRRLQDSRRSSTHHDAARAQINRGVGVCRVLPRNIWRLPVIVSRRRPGGAEENAAAEEEEEEEDADFHTLTQSHRYEAGRPIDDISP